MEGKSWIMYVVIGVVLVLMIVLTIIPQKKRQKQQQNMMNSLAVGTKIMTIGRMVGKITQVNPDNTLIVNVGTDASPTLIVIDRQAVGLVLENVAAPAAPSAYTPDPTAIADSTDTAASEPTVSAVEEAPVAEKKTSKKKGKKAEYDPLNDSHSVEANGGLDASSIDDIAPSIGSTEIFDDEK